MVGEDGWEVCRGCFVAELFVAVACCSTSVPGTITRFLGAHFHTSAVLESGNIYYSIKNKDSDRDAQVSTST